LREKVDRIYFLISTTWAYIEAKRRFSEVIYDTRGVRAIAIGVGLSSD
jgi:hypothetical protein